MELPLIFGAAIAGLLSFLSPCVFPLIPSYLAMLTGSSVSELKSIQQESRLTTRLLLRSLSFSLGFSVVFIVLGLVFSQAGSMIGNQSRIWGRIAGIVIIVLGLHTAFDLLGIFRRERRFHITKKPKGLVSSFLFGAAFGAGWSPCVGPILASILLLAGSGSILWAALLLGLYSAGLALPFILTALFFPRLQGLMGLIKKHLGMVKISSGILLVGIGTLMIFSDLRSLSSDLVKGGYLLQQWTEANYFVSKVLSVLFFIVLAVVSFFRLLHTRSIPGIVFLSIFTLLSILEAIGIINALELLSSWLLFQGI